jgi:hypothetical protein
LAIGKIHKNRKSDCIKKKRYCKRGRKLHIIIGDLELFDHCTILPPYLSNLVPVFIELSYCLSSALQKLIHIFALPHLSPINCVSSIGVLYIITKLQIRLCYFGVLGIPTKLHQIPYFAL